jgi:uncharacterized protein (DUF2235 family)
LIALAPPALSGDAYAIGGVGAGASMSENWLPKNIVLLSDGTGNSSSKIFKTNVWRLFQALDLTDEKKQVAYYDDGVGTSSFKWWAAFTGVFGIGLKRNVLDIYCFCCRNYEHKPGDETVGDRIFGFGFSRGSYTMRVVAGFIARIGLVRYENNEDELRSRAIVAYREYRKYATENSFAANFHLPALRALRDFFSHNLMGKPSFKQIEFTRVEKIHFLGLWDTVDAYGGPIDEIVRAIDYWYWPLSMPDRFMKGKIQRACHALSLEDERDAFKPVLWDERYVRTQDGRLVPMDQDWTPPNSANEPLPAIDRERISQVWFVGVHVDVGGGYPQDGLSYFTLDWMIDRARVYDLKLLDVQTDWLASLIDRFDKLNDSRHGVGAYYRYKPRKLVDIYNLPTYRLSIREDCRNIKRIWNEIPDPETDVRKATGVPDGVPLLPRPTPKIHDAVFERVDACIDGYVPIVIPQSYRVTNTLGRIEDNPRETSEQAKARAYRQERVWDMVWKRRVTYFTTMFGILFLACLPILQHFCPGYGAGSPFAFLIPIVDAVAAFLPNLVKPWLDAFRDAPERLFLGALVVGVLSWYGSWFQSRIRDLMREIWKNPITVATAPSGGIYALRTSGRYKACYYILTHWALPSLFAIVIAVILLALAYCAIAAVSRVSFLAFDVSGHVCTATPKTEEVKKAETRPFATSELCTATGLTVRKGQTYEVSLDITDAWEDGVKRGDPNKAKGIETDPNGFGWDKMTWKMTPGLPLRRLLSSNWFATIIRIGDSGFGEMVLSYKPADPPIDKCEQKDVDFMSGKCPVKQPRYTATFKAPKDGEVFIYVNDSVVLWPGFHRFYDNNKGMAKLTIMPKP